VVSVFPLVPSPALDPRSAPSPGLFLSPSRAASLKGHVLVRWPRPSPVDHPGGLALVLLDYLLAAASSGCNTSSSAAACSLLAAGSGRDVARTNARQVGDRASCFSAIPGAAVSHGDHRTRTSSSPKECRRCFPACPGIRAVPSSYTSSTFGVFFRHPLKPRWSPAQTQSSSNLEVGCRRGGRIAGGFCVNVHRDPRPEPLPSAAACDASSCPLAPPRPPRDDCKYAQEARARPIIRQHRGQRPAAGAPTFNFADSDPQVFRPPAGP